MTEPLVVVLGDVMLDVITVPSDEPAHGSDTASQISLRAGGSAANVAAWLADSGTRTAYVGRVGDDETGRQAIGALREVGVDARVVVDSHRPTGTCVVLVHPDGERTMFPEVGANATVSVPDVDEALADLDAASHLHVSGYALLSGSRDAATHALSLARRRSASTSVTCASAAPLRRVGPSTFLELTVDARLLFANVEEAELLTGRSDPSVAAAELTRSYTDVVVRAAHSARCTQHRVGRRFTCRRFPPWQSTPPVRATPSPPASCRRGSPAMTPARPLAPAIAAPLAPLPILAVDRLDMAARCPARPRTDGCDDL